MRRLRLDLNIDYDRLHELVSHHNTIREMLGHGDFDRSQYHFQTLMDNVSLLTPELLDQINQLVVPAGHVLIKKICNSFVRKYCRCCNTCSLCAALFPWLFLPSPARRKWTGFRTAPDGRWQSVIESLHLPCRKAATPADFNAHRQITATQKALIDLLRIVVGMQLLTTPFRPTATQAGSSAPAPHQQPAPASATPPGRTVCARACGPAGS